MTSDYIRGTRDAQRYARVEQTADGWFAQLTKTAESAWIIEPIDRDYLQGLYDGGCKVRLIDDVPRQSAMERLLHRVAQLAGAA